MPFHGSIFAWVRERNDHATVFEALLPDIVAWLKSDAPAAWRWAWLWITEARLGNSDALLAGATREWAVDSLAHGWHEDQIEEVFRQAEQIAFDQSNLAQTVAFRSIKTRVSNARDYQASDYGLFRACAIAISSNRQQARNLIDRLPFHLGKLAVSAHVWRRRARLGKQPLCSCVRILRARTVLYRASHGACSAHTEYKPSSPRTAREPAIHAPMGIRMANPPGEDWSAAEQLSSLLRPS